MSRAVDSIEVGVPERKIAIEASRAFLELGADSAFVGPIVSGRRTDSLHGGLGDQVLATGDSVHIELVPTVRGYGARLMRHVVLGPPTSIQIDTARRLFQIQDAQFAAIRPGARAVDVDRIARQAVLDAGIRERYDNATGYTLGYFGSPFPPRSSDFTRALLPSASWVFESGMVFHMYITSGAMSFSETVLVTEIGYERLTQSPRQLLSR
jgi:Xaa-Pro dipeptidase